MNAGKPPRLETERLVLDAHRADDFEALAAMWADPEVVRHITGKASTREASWSRLLRYAGLWPMLGYGYWAVREKSSGRYVGDAGFADFRRAILPSIEGLPEAGWVLAPWAHGKGYATEAIGAALDWLDRTQTHLRVAEKNGFVVAGPLTDGFENTSLLIRKRGSIHDENS